MYRRIVVPLDGSGLAEVALPQASELARLTGAPVHLLRVVDFTRLERYGPYALALEYAAAEPVLTDERAEAKAYLQDVQAQLDGEGLRADAEIRQGRVAREIVAALKPGDLVVIASHGRGGLSRWLLGSVAEDVVRHAAVPVLLVKTDPVTDTTVAPRATAVVTAN
ncbi:MAG TPA: universal stress protein [Thermomicrobiales bacterium]|jgi:nucleotide-binding universal stress UspA family protein